jgi:hypothetical protein
VRLVTQYSCPATLITIVVLSTGWPFGRFGDFFSAGSTGSNLRLKPTPVAPPLTVLVLGVDEVDVGVGHRQVLLGAAHGRQAPVGARVAAEDGRVACLVLAEFIVGQIGRVLAVDDRGALPQRRVATTPPHYLTLT